MKSRTTPSRLPASHIRVGDRLPSVRDCRDGVARIIAGEYLK
jgi:hypothetical protein